VELHLPEQALAVAEQATAAAREGGDRDAHAVLRALDARLFALMTVSAHAEAVTAGETLIDAADRAGDLHLASRARINTASSLNYLGQFEGAEALIERALPDVRSSRLRLLEAAAIHNLGMSRARLGQLDEGIEMQRQAAAIADECSGIRIATNARAYYALMLVSRGEPGDLRDAHALAQRIADDTKDQLGLQMVALHTLARVQLARRQLGEALEAAREVYRRLQHGPVEEWDEGIRMCLAEALLTTGQGEAADEVLRTAFEVVRKRILAIARSELRHSFTSRNDEVRQLLQMAETRLGLRWQDGVE